MTWFKVDDKLHDHRKARAAGAAAMGVWCLSGSWAADNLTDGFIPSTVLSRWGKPRDAARLVEVGLWFADEQDGEKGWRFHEWHERQPSRAQKLAEREAKAQAGRIGGLRSGRSRREAKTEAEPKHSATGQVKPPTRPEPDPSIEDADASSSRELTLTEAPRADVDQLCEHLAGLVEANGSKRPTITTKWRDAARLMLDGDGHTEADVHGAIEWCQRNEFWRANILSLPKLREKYDQLRLQAQREQPRTSQSRAAGWLDLARTLEETS